MGMRREEKGLSQRRGGKGRKGWEGKYGSRVHPLFNPTLTTAIGVTAKTFSGYANVCRPTTSRLSTSIGDASSVVAADETPAASAAVYPASRSILKPMIHDSEIGDGVSL